MYYSKITSCHWVDNSVITQIRKLLKIDLITKFKDNFKAVFFFKKTATTKLSLNNTQKVK